jgi:tetratricopeptide (TPR) repeat protein
VIRARAAAFACAALLAAAAAARAQDSSGAIDTRGDVEERIRYLEQFVGGDMAAEKQSVVYRWLADLYISAGRLDDAQRAYESILVFYPNDVGAANAFATFLLDHRHDPAAALKVLDDAVAWARSMENPPPYLGETHALRARALGELGRDEDALRAVERAVALMDAGAAEEALRVQARSLQSLGRSQEARETLLRVIGLSGGSNPGDESALIALMTEKSGKVDAKQVDAAVEKAILDARARRAEALKREGAEVVVIHGEGGARLEATLRRGKDAGAILMVPDLGGRRATWTPYAQLFSLDGITTLALDPRGHGDSRCDSLPSFADLTPDQRVKLPDDIAAGFDYLHHTLRVPAEKIVIVVEGASCALAERTVHERGIAPGLVHLSPVFDPDDRDLASVFEFRRPLPTLVAASDEDAFAMRSMALLTDTYPSPKTDTRVFSASGHGAYMLRNPGNFAAVSNWVRKTLGHAR